MEDNRAIGPLEEAQYPFVKSMILGSIAAMGVYCLARMLTAEVELTGELLVGVVIILGVGTALLLGLWGLYSRARLVMDDQGVLMKHLIARPHTLDWREVRTAAVVRLSNDPRYQWIVLSTNPEPAQVLIRKRLVWKSCVRGEEVRIPYTDRRRAVAEHYLNKKLPDIKL